MADDRPLCQCGCGAMLDIARFPSEQARFVHGHNRRGARWTESQRRRIPRFRGATGYAAIHIWLNRNHPRTGRCERCGSEPGTRKPSGTQWAFKRHPAPYTHNVDDYRELCPSCHAIVDHRGSGRIRDTRGRFAA